nr:M64 family metallopeptidase [Polyangiaceae bacterium]
TGGASGASGGSGGSAAASGGAAGVAGGLSGAGGTAGSPSVDPCKHANVEDPSIAKLIHQGSGMIDTPKDHPSTTPVPIASPASCLGGKIDIVIMPEGYKADELVRFEQDAALWLKEFLSLSPYKEYREAFNVWTVRLPSKEHVAVGGSDTAFGMALTSNGSGVAFPTAPDLVDMGKAFFQGLSYVPVNRQHKQGSVLQQVVGVVLVLKPTCSNLSDPTKACDGFSGWTRTPQDPSDSTVAVKVAVAQNRMHELGHALSQLKDEYRDDQFDDGCLNASKYAGYNPTNYSISNIGNYSYSNQASDLPWAHLLDGAGIQSTPGLIGAYQGSYGCWEGAWRPEYRCLMNGTHGNSDSCNPGGGVSLRQGDFCNWCRELAVLRIFDALGMLDTKDPLKDWSDSYRSNYWKQYPVTLPNAGMPIVDSCKAPKPFEAPL